MISQAEKPMIEGARAQWNAAAEGWDAQSPALRAWLSKPTRTMLEMAGVEPGNCALDVAAGAGDQTIALAERIGPQGRIVATDLSPMLIERLRRNVLNAGFSKIEARTADAQMPLSEVDVFDAAICRLSLMLMPEPARCLAAVRAALKPGGRFAALVFAGPAENPCIRILMTTALRHAGLPSRDPFAPGGLLSLGRPGHLDELFATAGFTEVSTFRIEAPFQLPSVDGYIAFLRAAAAPVMAILSRLPPPAQEKAWADIRAQLTVFEQGNVWVGPNTLLLTSGRK
jgi:SAM-dependent methyltransferase